MLHMHNPTMLVSTPAYSHRQVVTMWALVIEQAGLHITYTSSRNARRVSPLYCHLGRLVLCKCIDARHHGGHPAHPSIGGCHGCCRAQLSRGRWAAAHRRAKQMGPAMTPLAVLPVIPRTVCLRVRMYVCMCVCMSVCLSVCMYVCMHVCLPVRLSACLPVCMYVCLTVCLSVCMYVCLPVCLSVCLSACMSVCMSAGLYNVICLSGCQTGCLSVCMSV